MTLRVSTSPRTAVRPPDGRADHGRASRRIARTRGVRVWSATFARLATIGALAGAVASIACRPSAGERGAIPAASLLVSAGDSTFWIESDSGGLRVRRSAILLTELDGRLHELYLADDDRSFYDAVILGQSIFRRDLAAGDSVLLATDSVLAGLAREYAARHPQELPLAPDEEAAEEPSIHATTDTELLDAMGPFLVFEQHVDIDRGQSRDVHLTRRGVLDVRDGRQVTVADLVGEPQAGEIFRQAQALLAAAIDSIRLANDERARRAATALTGFALDSSSFALVEEDGEPAIAFLVPGRGPRAGGYALPLAPLRIAAGPWWGAVRPALLTPAGDRLAWQRDGLELVAREDSTGEWASVSLRLAAGEWPLGRFPLPLRRVHRLDSASASPETIAALRRAFDEAAIYSGEVRTAVTPAVGTPLARPAASGRNRYVLPLDARASSGVLASGAASAASRLACLALRRPA